MNTVRSITKKNRTEHNFAKIRSRKTARFLEKPNFRGQTCELIINLIALLSEIRELRRTDITANIQACNPSNIFARVGLFLTCHVTDFARAKLGNIRLIFPNILKLCVLRKTSEA